MSQSPTTPATNNGGGFSRWVYGTLAVLLLVLLAAGGYLHHLGTSDRWTPIVWVPGSPAELSIDRATLSPTGTHLLWVDVATGALCVYDLSVEGRVSCLDPGDCPAVNPIGFSGEDVLVLRTRFRKGTLSVVADGWKRLLGTEEEEDLEEGPVIPLGTPRTTYLERVGIDTGEVFARAPGATSRVSLENLDPTDFEMGAVTASPDGAALAWWRASEEREGSPLSATVTETLEVLSADAMFSPLVKWSLSSGGNLFVRSRLLRELGWPHWIDNDRFFLFSFLDGGSFIPFDRRENAPLATVPMGSIIRDMVESNPHILYGPEGVVVGSDVNSGRPEIVFWARQEDSLHFFHYNSDFVFSHETTIATKGFQFAQAIWLRNSEALLVADLSRERLVAFDTGGEQEAVYPLPYGWSEGFDLLGEDSQGNLLGTNRRVFMRVSPGGTDWEILELR
jgi:hypothetical protein